MMLKDSLKRFSLRHTGLLNIYRKTFGKIKTTYYFNAQRKALQKNGSSLIGTIDEALSSAGAKYFIDCGTLLGFIRDNKPIAYDRDMDFGIYFDSVFTPEKLEGILRGLGLRKISIGYFHDEVQEMTFASGLVHIDFFRHTEIDNNSLLYVFYRNPEIIYPSNNHYSIIVQKRLHIPSLKRVTFGNFETNIPSNVEDYLASAYSDNWKQPDPDWRYTMEPGCTYLDGEYGVRY